MTIKQGCFLHKQHLVSQINNLDTAAKPTWTPQQNLRAKYVHLFRLFNLFAVKYFTNREISFSFEKPSCLSNRKFKSLFLLSVHDVAALWRTLDEKKLPFNCPEHLLWALYYMKVYPTWDQMAMTTGVSEKTNGSGLAL